MDEITPSAMQIGRTFDIHSWSYMYEDFSKTTIIRLVVFKYTIRFFRKYHQISMHCMCNKILQWLRFPVGSDMMISMYNLLDAYLKFAHRPNLTKGMWLPAWTHAEWLQYCIDITANLRLYSQKSVMKILALPRPQQDSSVMSSMCHLVHKSW